MITVPVGFRERVSTSQHTRYGRRVSLPEDRGLKDSRLLPLTTESFSRQNWRLRGFRKCQLPLFLSFFFGFYWTRDGQTTVDSRRPKTRVFVQTYWLKTPVPWGPLSSPVVPWVSNGFMTYKTLVGTRGSSIGRDVFGLSENRWTEIFLTGSTRRFPQ